MQQFDFATDVLFCVELFNRGDEVGVGFKIAQVVFTVFGGIFSCVSCGAMYQKRVASKIDKIKRKNLYEWLAKCSAVRQTRLSSFLLGSSLII